jgi:hypothetical protein
MQHADPEAVMPAAPAPARTPKSRATLEIGDSGGGGGADGSGAPPPPRRNRPERIPRTLQVADGRPWYRQKPWPFLFFAVSFSVGIALTIGLAVGLTRRYAAPSNGVARP